MIETVVFAVVWFFCFKPAGRKIVAGLLARCQLSYYTGIRLLERCDDRPTSILRGMPFWKITVALSVLAFVPICHARLIVCASFDGNDPLTKLLLMFGTGAIVYFVAGTAWTLEAIYYSRWMIVQRGISQC
ncbi:MAG: hypothetical protein ACRYFS_00735 [Janthinobacterium lividum]